MQRFIVILLSWLAVIVVTFMLMLSALEQEDGGVAQTDISGASKQLAILRQAETHYRQQEYQPALQLLEARENLFTDKKLPADVLLRFYLLKGKVHWQLWEYVEAEQAWQFASLYAQTASQHNMVAKLVRDSQRVLDDINQERNDKNLYYASPHVGPAGELKGKIALIYVYLVDGGGNSWSLRDRDYVQAIWNSAQNWLESKARQYHSNVVFSKRLFIIDKHPQISRMQIGDVSSKFRNVDEVTTLAANQFGFPDILSFIEHIRQEEHADQAMLIFHLARDGRSFASRCMRRCSEQGEFVVLLESTRSKKWQSLQYAQAHESLHLFGADDLYNIRNAKYYAVRDIMNYPSSQLPASTLEGLTAWSVGIGTRKPEAPFKIKLMN